jgi:ubiquinone/menaquinone biosynthesis C-methylase UbiE
MAEDRDLQAAWTQRDAQRFERLGISSGRAAAIEAVARWLEQAMTPGERVLDVGCGVGLLATAVSGFQLVGIDFSASLLATAQERMPVAQGSVFSLPIRDSAFAAVTCLFVLDDYPGDSKLRALRSLIDPIRPGGFLVVASYAPDDERMGTRRAEFGSMAHPVHLETASFYEDALEQLGGTDSVTMDEMRVVGDIDGSSVHRHFFVNVVRRA